MRIQSILNAKCRFFSAGALAAMVALLLAVVGSLLGMFSRTDRALSDWRATFATTEASGQTVIVGIDQVTLAQYGGWSIGRARMASVLHKLAEAGAQRVYIDNSFAEKSEPASDAALEAALARLGPQRVALPVVVLQGKPDESGHRPAVKVQSMERFHQHATAVSADLPFDRDGRVRSMGSTPFGNVASHPTVASWLAAGQQATPGVSKIDVGVELETIPVISFLDVEREGLPPNAVKGKNVVVGLVAERVAPPINVPRYGDIQRAEFMAIASETLIHNAEPISVSLWMVIACTAPAVVLLGLALPRCGIIGGGIATLLSMAVLYMISIELQRRTGLSLPVGLPFAAFILTYVGTLVATHPAFQHTRQAAISLVDKVDYGLARLFHSGVDAIITFSPDGRILTVNETAERLFGMPADAVLGMPLSTVLPETADSLLRSASGHQPGRLETTFADNSGQDRHVDLAFNAMPSDTGWVGYASIRDITEMKTREEALKHQASHDAMTGLPNRAAFERHLEATLRFATETSRPFAVFMLDLNKFKQVNDTLGHQVGDALLIEVAKRFGNLVRTSDFVARLGGDEFAVVMAPPTSPDCAESLASRMVESIAELTELEGHVIETGTSIGVAFYPDDAQSSADLVGLADEAMYAAKRGNDGYKLAAEMFSPAG